MSKKEIKKLKVNCGSLKVTAAGRYLSRGITIDCDEDKELFEAVMSSKPDVGEEGSDKPLIALEYKEEKKKKAKPKKTTKKKPDSKSKEDSKKEKEDSKKEKTDKDEESKEDKESK